MNNLKLKSSKVQMSEFWLFPTVLPGWAAILHRCRLRADADSKIAHCNTFIRICRDTRQIFLTRAVAYLDIWFFHMGEMSYLRKLKFWSKISDSRWTHSFNAFFQMVRMAIGQLTPQWFNHQSLLGDIIVATFVVNPSFSQIHKWPFSKKNECNWQVTKLTVVSQLPMSDCFHHHPCNLQNM